MEKKLSEIREDIEDEVEEIVATQSLEGDDEESAAETDIEQNSEQDEENSVKILS